MSFFRYKLERHDACVLSISKVVKRTLLVDDTDGRLLSADSDTLDVVGSLPESFEFAVDGVSSFDSSLCVEFGGVGDLEKNVLHDVGAEGSLELERLSLKADFSDRLLRLSASVQTNFEKDVVEPPSLGSQH